MHAFNPYGPCSNIADIVALYGHILPFSLKAPIDGCRTKKISHTEKKLPLLQVTGPFLLLVKRLQQMFDTEALDHLPLLRDHQHQKCLCNDPHYFEDSDKDETT